MFSTPGDDDSWLMVTRGLSGRERRVWRAAVFALAVMAQLVVPSIAMRAQALAAQLCVVQTDGDSDSSKGHVHQQQCAHCRVHDCSALTPPAVRVVAAVRVAAVEPVVALPPRVVPGRRAQPPSTGPPAP
jgi:hypothetical protein